MEMNATPTHAEIMASATISYPASHACDCVVGYTGPQCQYAKGRLRVFIRNATDLPRRADGSFVSPYVNVIAYRHSVMFVVILCILFCGFCESIYMCALQYCRQVKVLMKSFTSLSKSRHTATPE